MEKVQGSFYWKKDGSIGFKKSNKGKFTVIYLKGSQ